MFGREENFWERRREAKGKEEGFFCIFGYCQQVHNSWILNLNGGEGVWMFQLQDTHS